MTALAKQKVESDQDCFVPTPDLATAEKPEHWNGERKGREPVSARQQITWSKHKEAKVRHAERMSMFRVWHEFSFKRATKAKCTPAIIFLGQIWQHFNVQHATAWAGDQLMAHTAGVSEKTISRGVKFLYDDGCLDRVTVYKKHPKTKKLTKVRHLHFTFPEGAQMPSELQSLDDDPTDSSGPELTGSVTDHISPKITDSSGPFTVEETVEKGRADAA